VVLHNAGALEVQGDRLWDQVASLAGTLHNTGALRLHIGGRTAGTEFDVLRTVGPLLVG
jgi:hypothetical protein